MCLCFWTFRCQETLPRDGSLEIGECRGSWKVNDCKRGVNGFPEGLCRREGKDKGWICFGHSQCHMESKEHWECTLEQLADNCSLRGQVA